MILQGPYARRPSLGGPPRPPKERPARVDPLDLEHASPYMKRLLRTIAFLHQLAERGTPTPKERRKMRRLGLAMSDVREIQHGLRARAVLARTFACRELLDGTEGA